MYKMQVSIAIVKQAEHHAPDQHYSEPESPDPVKRDDAGLGRIVSLMEKVTTGGFSIPDRTAPAVVIGVTNAYDLGAEDHAALLLILRKFHELGCEFGAPAIEGLPVGSISVPALSLPRL